MLINAIYRTLSRSISYQQAFQRAVSDPEGYWKEYAQQIKWHQFPKTILKE